MKPLRGAVVGLDTAPLIYFIEEHSIYLTLPRPFFEAVSNGDLQAVTSVLTLAEVLVHPMRHGDRELANQYRRILLHAEHLSTLPVSHEIAQQAAEFRAQFGLRTPDAVQLATASGSGATFFLTNDRHLKAPATIKVLVLNHLVTH